MSALDDDERRAQWLDMESQHTSRYISLIADLTPPLKATVQIGLDEAKAIVRRYRTKVLGHNSDIGAAAGCRNDDDSLLRSLEERLNAAIGGSPSFVRLESRSPKDCVLFPPLDVRVVAEIATRIRREPRCGRVEAAMQATVDALRVSDGEEALRLLVHSERVSIDLQRACEFSATSSDDADWTMAVVVREWVPIRYALEFRAFAVGGRIVAVSQYDPSLFVSELQDDTTREALVDAMVRLGGEVGRRVHGVFRDDSFVVDFGFASADQPDGGLVVEINSSSPGTGGALFHWDSDEALLKRGECDGGDGELPVVRWVRKQPFSTWPEVEKRFHPELVEMIKRADAEAEAEWRVEQEKKCTIS